jgi:hypothetical protein
LEYWSIGALEYWRKLNAQIQTEKVLIITPLLHYSITPLLQHSIIPTAVPIKKNPKTPLWGQLKVGSS